AVRDAQWAESGFDARFSATWRRYRYLVLNTPTPDPMLVGRAWHVREPLSLPLMNLACDGLIGEQDFTSFCRRPDTPEGAGPASMKRYVMEARWTDNNDGTLVFDIRTAAEAREVLLPDETVAREVHERQ
ncbi:MAG: hypothetical protein ACKORY_05005, partial [Actinomycetota bacterium]